MIFKQLVFIYFETEETTPADEIKVHKVMLKNQRSRISSGNSGLKLAEMRAAIVAQNDLRKLIDKKEKSLSEITAKKVKLLDTRIAKKK